MAPRASEPRPPRDLAEPRPRRDLAELTWTSPAIRGEPTSSGIGQSETFPPFALAILAALVAAAAVIARALGSLRPALTVPPAPPFPAVASAGGSSSLAAIVDTAATATARELMPFERAAETNSLPTYEPPVAVGAAAEEWAHCEIRWWRGYVKSQFYAAAPDDEATALCHSPAFRWRHDFPPPETEEAIAAHRALIDRLLAEGWELDGRRADWYADTLRQRQQLESGT